MGFRGNVALVSDGGEPHQKTTASGANLSIKVMDDDGSEWAREAMRSGRIYVTRSGMEHPSLVTSNMYCPLKGANHWRDFIMMTNEDHATGSGATDTQPSQMETVLTSQTNEPQTDSADDGINHLPIASVLVGGTVGAIARSITYGGSNRWIRPMGLILAGLFLGIAETTDYPVISTSSILIVNMTSEFVEIATEPSTNFWSTLESWLIDLLFFLTTAAFAMAGVRYAYLKIAEFLAAMTRRVLPGKSAQVTEEAPNTVTICKATPVHPKKTPKPIVEDIADSSATSGKSDDDLFPGKDTFPIGERCQSDRLFFRSRSSNATVSSSMYGEISACHECYFG